MLRLSTLRCAMAAFVAVVLTFAATDVDARGFRVGFIPNGGSLSCDACHEFPGGPRNAFGLAVEELVTVNGQEEFWTAELAMMDSDGDGKTNGEELLDPGGAWVLGDPDPGEPDSVTNPGVEDEFGGNTVGPFNRADYNADGAVNIADPVATLNFLFAGSAGPGCMRAADANGDGAVNIADATFVLSFLFAGAAAPPAPFNECAEEDEDASAQTCEISNCEA